MLKGHPRITVEIKDKENITYPEYDPTWHSETKKTLVRDIVNASYATEIAVGSSKVISWKALSAAENQGRFIDPECLPGNFQWQDPSHLAVTDVEALLGHWENRRSEGLKALIFTEVLHNGNLVSVDELPELLAVSKSRRKGVKSRYRAVEEARGTDENQEETEDTPEATEVVHSPRKLRARKGSRKGNNYDDILGPLSDEESGEDSEAYNEDGKKGDGEDDSEDTDEDDTEVRPRTEDIPTTTPTSKLKWRPLQHCIWGHGQEKVVTANHLFPIPNLPPSTASRSATTSMRKDFVRKLIPNTGYREEINILEVLGELQIEPPPRMLHTAAGAPWISWKFDEPWIPEAWWREPGSIEGIRQWFQTTPFVLNNGDLAGAEEVDEPLRALAGLLSGWIKVVEAEVELEKAMDELTAKTALPTVAPKVGAGLPAQGPTPTRPLPILSIPTKRNGTGGAARAEEISVQTQHLNWTCTDTLVAEWGDKETEHAWVANGTTKCKCSGGGVLGISTSASAGVGSATSASESIHRLRNRKPRQCSPPLLDCDPSYDGWKLNWKCRSPLGKDGPANRSLD
ncbi:hypothetical protein DENSPDRAFT_855527 [Dentipellis sp. KUC8613]|nr:hypothetical protein DENSPDRAFT_855527 [Dentipellis sp. KUC8613]